MKKGKRFFASFISLGVFGFLALAVGTVIKDIAGGNFADGNSNWNYPRIAKAVQANGAAGDDIEWDFDSDTGVLNITGSGDMSSYSQGGAPWYEYRGYIKSIIVAEEIDSISVNAFYQCNNLQSIQLPFIGKSRTATGFEGTFGYIFGYTTLQAYQTGSSTTYNYVYDATTKKYIGQGYMNMNSTKTANYADYVVSTSSNSLSIPSGTVFQYSSYNTNYESYSSSYKGYPLLSYYYYIPSSLKKIDVTDASKISTSAFRNCTNITEINLNDLITSVDPFAFWQSSIPTLNNEEFVIRGKILIGYNGTNTNVIIPDGVGLIASRAFYNKSNITSVVFPESVYFVGESAFSGCSKASITIPKKSGSLTLGTDAFKNVTRVSYVDVNTYTNGNDTYVFEIDSNGNAIIVGCSTTSTAITLPTTLGDCPVIAVGYKGMANCTSLTSITIPSNIQYLDSFAFDGCAGLTTVTIPSTVSSVMEYAFRNCTNLHTVTIAEGVEYIGDFAFYNCRNLMEIVIPDSCEYLGGYAFYNCTSLESATIGITVPEIGDYTFYNCTSLATAVIGTSVTRIGDYAFYNCALTRLTTPNTLITIGKYAFAYNTSLARVTLRNNLQTIGDGAFKGCSSLVTINWPSSIRYIGSHAFEKCSSLTSVTIPVLVDEINDYTFANCTSLASVTINGEIKDVGADNKITITNAKAGDYIVNAVLVGNENYTGSYDVKYAFQS